MRLHTPGYRLPPSSGRVLLHAEGGGPNSATRGTVWHLPILGGASVRLKPDAGRLTGRLHGLVANV